MEGGGRHQCRSPATEGLALSFGSICYKCISHSQDIPPVLEHFHIYEH